MADASGSATNVDYSQRDSENNEGEHLEFKASTLTALTALFVKRIFE
jgi:hypothetical protein